MFFPSTRYGDIGDQLIIPKFVAVKLQFDRIWVGAGVYKRMLHAILCEKRVETIF